MRTTLDLPQQLLEEAMALSEAKSKTKTIIIALRELVQKSKISALKKYKGRLDLNIDIDHLRGRNV
jgi:hypothetical protein